MGHDEHFLQRLDRLNVPEVELALALYRDHELVRWILMRAKVPYAVDRIAIALTTDESPPHVIVARDGGFVTCLAAGMSVGTCHRIPLTRLGSLHGERERFDTIADTLERSGQSFVGIFDRVMAAGDRVCREDIAMLVPFAPLAYSNILEFAGTYADRLPKVVATVLAMLDRRHRDERILHSYWCVTHGLSYMLMLLAEMEEHIFGDPKAPQADTAQQLFALLGKPVTRHATLLFYVRHAWAMARAGRPAFEALSMHYVTEASGANLFHSFGPLAAMAVRRPDLREEILALFGGETAHEETLRKGGAPAPSAMRLAAEKYLLGVIDDPDFATAGHRDARRYVNARWVSHRMSAERFRAFGSEYSLALATADDLPFHPAPGRRLADEELEETYFPMMPMVARAEMADLFLPRSLLGEIDDWSPAHVERMLLSERARLHKTPRKAAATPGRNDPCSCGSKKKYKRCCAA